MRYTESPRSYEKAVVSVVERSFAGMLLVRGVVSYSLMRKKRVSVVAGVAFLYFTSAFAAGERVKISLNDDWRFVRRDAIRKKTALMSLALMEGH